MMEKVEKEKLDCIKRCEDTPATAVDKMVLDVMDVLKQLGINETVWFQEVRRLQS